MNTLINSRIAVIGAGNIGRMLLDRMCAMDVPASLISVCDSDPERAKSAAAVVGASVFDLAALSGCEASVWLLCTGRRV
jgi:predicted dehydrogenase